MISNCIHLAGEGLRLFAQKVASYEEDKVINRYTEVPSGAQMITFMKTPHHASIGEDIYVVLKNSGLSLPMPAVAILQATYRTFRMAVQKAFPLTQSKFEALATRAINKRIPPHGLLIQHLFSLAVIGGGAISSYTFYSRAFQLGQGVTILPDTLLGGTCLLLLVREIWASALSTRFVPAPAAFSPHLGNFAPGEAPQIL